MDVELQALVENHTWDVVDLPPGKHPIGCRWVYKIKYKADGSLEREINLDWWLKSITQMDDIDYFDIFLCCQTYNS